MDIQRRPAHTFILAYPDFQRLRIDDIDPIGHTAPNRFSDARHAPHGFTTLTGDDQMNISQIPRAI